MTMRPKRCSDRREEKDIREVLGEERTVEEEKAAGDRKGGKDKANERGIKKKRKRREHIDRGQNQQEGGRKERDQGKRGKMRRRGL